MPQMLAVQLDRVDRSVPWGIQLAGGCDCKTPLCIASVSGSGGRKRVASLRVGFEPAPPSAIVCCSTAGTR